LSYLIKTIGILDTLIKSKPLIIKEPKTKATTLQRPLTKGLVTGLKG
jgi:hypothetical protein